MLLVRATKSHQIERVQFVATLSQERNFDRHCRRNRQLDDNVAGFGDNVAAFGRFWRHCRWCGRGFKGLSRTGPTRFRTTTSVNITVQNYGRRRETCVCKILSIWNSRSTTDRILAIRNHRFTPTENLLVNALEGRAIDFRLIYFSDVMTPCIVVQNV